MKTYLMCIVFGILSTTLSCGKDQGKDSTLAADHSRGTDVQITGLAGSKALCFIDRNGSFCSGYDTLKPELQCELIGQTESSSSISKTFDCTLAIAGKYGRPMLNKVTATGSQSKIGNDRRMHFTGLVFIKTAYAVVKTEALNAASFEGIGFSYVSVFFKPWRERPRPSGPDAGWYTVKSGLNITGTTQLKSGEPATQLAFSLAVKGGHPGSSYSVGAYFRPFTKYVNNGQEYVQWDRVLDDYFTSARTAFDRSADILQ